MLRRHAFADVYQLRQEARLLFLPRRRLRMLTTDEDGGHALRIRCTSRGANVAAWWFASGEIIHDLAADAAAYERWLDTPLR